MTYFVCHQTLLPEEEWWLGTRLSSTVVEYFNNLYQEHIVEHSTLHSNIQTQSHLHYNHVDSGLNMHAPSTLVLLCNVM